MAGGGLDRMTDEVVEEVEEVEEVTETPPKEKNTPPAERRNRRRPRNEPDDDSHSGDSSGDSRFADCPECGAMYGKERIDVHRFREHGIDRRAQTAPPPPEKTEGTGKAKPSDAKEAPAKKRGWFAGRNDE
jgi:hypothetical protein